MIRNRGRRPSKASNALTRYFIERGIHRQKWTSTLGFDRSINYIPNLAEGWHKPNRYIAEEIAKLTGIPATWWSEPGVDLRSFRTRKVGQIDRMPNPVVHEPVVTDILDLIDSLTPNLKPGMPSTYLDEPSAPRVRTTWRRSVPACDPRWAA